MMMKRLPAPSIPSWLDAQLPFQERHMLRTHDSHWLHVMENSPRDRDDDITVVLLHGNPTWGFLYRKVVSLLAPDGLHVVVPDLLGLGLSEKPRNTRVHTLESHARRIGDVLDAFARERVVFVGQDWGGSIGLRAFADRPERLAGLVLLNTAITPPRQGFRPTWFHRFAQWPILSEIVFRGFGFPQNMLWIAQGDRRPLPEVAQRAYTYPLRGLANNAAPLALARMVPDSQTHPSVAALRVCQEYVTSLSCPAEIVWGDRDPILGRVRSWMEKLLPHARVTATQGGHFIQEEEPEAIAQAIRRVVEAVRHHEVDPQPARP